MSKLIEFNDFYTNKVNLEIGVFDVVKKDDRVLINDEHYINTISFEEDLHYFCEISSEFLQNCKTHLKSLSKFERVALRKMKEDLQFVYKILEKVKYLHTVNVFDLKLDILLCIKMIDVFISASYFLVKNDCNVN